MQTLKNSLKLFENTDEIIVDKLSLPEQMRITPALIFLANLGMVKNFKATNFAYPLESTLLPSGIRKRNEIFRTENQG